MPCTTRDVTKQQALLECCTMLYVKVQLIPQEFLLRNLLMLPCMTPDVRKDDRVCAVLGKTKSLIGEIEKHDSN